MLHPQPPPHELRYLCDHTQGLILLDVLPPLVKILVPDLPGPLMAGIEGVSAIATFLQVGFSLATTLNAYIENVRDAPDEVAELATEMNATLWQVEQLSSLIAQNNTSQTWSVRGIQFAQKCLAESESIIKKLANLVEKSGSNIIGTGIVTGDAIDFTIFKKLRWPAFRPQLEKVKRRLECTRIDICLLFSMHQTISGATPAERQSAGVKVTQFLHNRVALKAKLRSLAAMEHQQSTDDDVVSVKSRHVKFEPERKRSSSRRRRRKHKYSMIDMGEGADPMRVDGSDLGIETVRLDTLTTAIRDMVNEEIRLEEATRRKAEQEKKQHENDLLRQYEKDLVQKYERLEQEALETKERLKRTFGPLPAEEVDNHVREIQRELLEKDKVLQRIDALSKERAMLDDVSQDPSSTRSVDIASSRWSLWRRSLKEPSNSLPAALKQQHDIPNCARVTSIELSCDGADWHALQVNVPLPWLIQQLTVEEKRYSKRQGKLNATLEIYSKLPKACKMAAESWLKAVGNRKYAWELLYAHTAIPSVSRTRKFLQKAIFGSTIEQATNYVLLVFKATRGTQRVQHADQKDEIETILTTPKDDEGLLPRNSEDGATVRDNREVPETPVEHLGESSRTSRWGKSRSKAPAATSQSPYPATDPVRRPRFESSAESDYRHPYAGTRSPYFSPSAWREYAYSPYPDLYASPMHGPDPFRPTSYSYNYQEPSGPSWPAPVPPPPTSQSPMYSTAPEYRDRYDSDRSGKLALQPRRNSSSRRRDKMPFVYDRQSRPVVHQDRGSSYSRVSTSRLSRNVDDGSQSRRSSSRRSSIYPDTRPQSRAASVAPRSKYRHEYTVPSRRTAAYHDDRIGSHANSLSSKRSDERSLLSNTSSDDSWTVLTYSETGTDKQSSRLSSRSKRAESRTSTTRGLEDNHQPPNWVIHNRQMSTSHHTSSTSISSDDSNLSLDAKTLGDDELRTRMLMKYTNPEPKSTIYSGTRIPSTTGPMVEEMFSEVAGSPRKANVTGGDSHMSSAMNPTNGKVDAATSVKLEPQSTSASDEEDRTNFVPLKKKKTENWKNRERTTSLFEDAASRPSSDSNGGGERFANSPSNAPWDYGPSALAMGEREKVNGKMKRAFVEDGDGFETPAPPPPLLESDGAVAVTDRETVEDVEDVELNQIKSNSNINAGHGLMVTR